MAILHLKGHNYKKYFQNWFLNFLGAGGRGGGTLIKGACEVTPKYLLELLRGTSEKQKVSRIIRESIGKLKVKVNIILYYRLILSIILLRGTFCFSGVGGGGGGTWPPAVSEFIGK